MNDLAKLDPAERARRFMQIRRKLVANEETSKEETTRQDPLPTPSSSKQHTPPTISLTRSASFPPERRSRDLVRQANAIPYNDLGTAELIEAASTYRKTDSIGVQDDEDARQDGTGASAQSKAMVRFASPIRAPSFTQSDAISPIYEANKAVVKGVQLATDAGAAILLDAFNTARQALGLSTLVLAPFLNHDAAQFARVRTDFVTPKPKVLQFYFRARHYRVDGEITRIQRAQIQVDAAQAPVAMVRLISPANLGALACGEIWVSGKYNPTNSAAYSVIMNSGYSMIGIAQDRHGRWIVEFV